MSDEGEDLDIIVEFGNDRFDVYTNMEATLADLKHIIYTVTDIQPFRQSFSNLKMPARLKNDDCKLKEFNITSNFKLKLVDIMCEPLPSSSSEDEDEDEGDTCKKTEPQKKQPCIHVYQPERIKRRYKFKAIGLPRVDKNLVILDIDQTIYDYGCPNKNFSGRPFLQEFLTRIYDKYDIGIWSNTDMKTLEYKLNVLQINNHSDYKLLFYMDIYSTVSVPMGDCVFQVKSLEAVWKKYPQYNHTNTVICDDKRENFYFNPKNGILVAPYYYQDRKKDDELLKLLAYLEYIAESNNLTMFEHKHWKLQFISKKKSDSN